MSGTSRLGPRKSCGRQAQGLNSATSCKRTPNPYRCHCVASQPTLTLACTVGVEVTKITLCLTCMHHVPGHRTKLSKTQGNKKVGAKTDGLKTTHAQVPQFLRVSDLNSSHKKEPWETCALPRNVTCSVLGATGGRCFAGPPR